MFPFFCFSSAFSQHTKGEFFGYLVTAANFCQIDGDAASGYNKFGFTAGYMVGQGLGAMKKGDIAYETGAAFSIRGSRRPFDPENPGNASFHLIYQMVDIPVFIHWYLDKFSVSAGMRTTYLIKAEDRDSYILNLQKDMRKVNILGCVGGDYQLADDWRIFLEMQYSINSIRIANNNTNIFYNTGVFHNVISLGTKWQITGNK
ncbi:MAG: outer membrane beta-barrel protein [Bacteroidetes bacterium]|nr:outer membrane beta-barrel protein [Bacteroidota bacterium]